MSIAYYGGWHVDVEIEVVVGDRDLWLGGHGTGWVREGSDRGGNESQQDRMRWSVSGERCG